MTRRNERPGDFRDRVAGRRVLSLTRRGKFLLARLEGDITWVSHLGMSGRFSINQPGEPESPHTNVVIHLRLRPEVRLVDPRTFGFVAAFTPAELERAMSTVGPDALDALPDSRTLAGVLSGRTAPIKALLLDQRLISGLGNIYADEVLHRVPGRSRAFGGITLRGRGDCGAQGDLARPAGWVASWRDQPRRSRLPPSRWGCR